MKSMSVIAAITCTFLVSCTHAHISSIPTEVPGVGTVYRYQGRANFAHQFREAERLITAECKSINGGLPRIVQMGQYQVGTTGIVNNNVMGNITASGNPNYMSGTFSGSGLGTVSTMSNMNQEIYFMCVNQ